LVDKIGGVVDVDPELLEKPTETLKAGVLAVTSHVCKLEKQLLLVLDTEKIIQIAVAAVPAVDVATEAAARQPVGGVIAI
jgi:purine-binding chemotaxis protein CheW